MRETWRSDAGKMELERAKGFEPSTPTLARLCSTPELRPLWRGRAPHMRGPAGRRAISSGPVGLQVQMAAAGWARSALHIRAARAHMDVLFRKQGIG